MATGKLIGKLVAAIAIGIFSLELMQTVTGERFVDFSWRGLGMFIGLEIYYFASKLGVTAMYEWRQQRKWR